ncbi:hypothetical protein D3C76_1886330 [compost metagenome]
MALLVMQRTQVAGDRLAVANANVHQQRHKLRISEDFRFLIAYRRRVGIRAAIGQRR